MLHAIQNVTRARLVAAERSLEPQLKEVRSLIVREGADYVIRQKHHLSERMAFGRGIASMMGADGPMASRAAADE